MYNSISHYHVHTHAHKCMFWFPFKVLFGIFIEDLYNECGVVVCSVDIHFLGCLPLAVPVAVCMSSVALRSFDLTTYKNREEAGHGSHLELSVIAHTLHFHMMPLQDKNLFV